MLGSLSQNKIPALLGSQLLSLFNSKFFNREHYETHTDNIWFMDNEFDKEDDNILLRDVIRFCMNTNVCKQLNISMFDIYERMDLGTYTMLKDIIVEDNKQRERILDENQKKMEQANR